MKITLKFMKLTPKIQYAINRAAELHAGQMRKVTKTPFFTHPFSVALILSQYTTDENIVVAGLLHDVLEDVPKYKYEDMKKEFGVKIADLVQGVSEVKSPRTKKTAKQTWMDRKDSYLKKLKTDPYEALMISAADKIHNLRSMIDEYKKGGEKIWKKFNAPEDKKVWFYGEVLSVLKERLQNPIVKELEKTYHEAENIFGLECDGVACYKIGAVAK